jgi:hypothetical protein
LIVDYQKNGMFQKIVYISADWNAGKGGREGREGKEGKEYSPYTHQLKHKLLLDVVINHHA